MNSPTRLWSAIFKVGVYKYAAELVGFIGSMVVSRLLVPEEYGVIILVAIFYGFVARFSDPGITESLLRAKNEEVDRSIIFWIYLLHGLLLALFMWALAWPITLIYDEPRLLGPAFAYGLILWFYAWPGASESYLLRAKQYQKIFKTELLGAIVAVLLTIILAARGWSYWSLILPQLVVPWIFWVKYRRWQPIPLKPLKWQAFRNSIRKMRTLVWQVSKVNAVEYWEEQADNFMVGKVHDTATLGIYHRAFFAAHLPRALAKPIVNSVLIPEWRTLPIPDVAASFLRLVKVFLASTTLPLILTTIWPHELAITLWGDDWIGVGSYLQILGISMGFQLVLAMAKPVMILQYQEKTFARYSTWLSLLTLLAIVLTVWVSVQLMVQVLVAITLLVKFPAFVYFCAQGSLNLKWRQLLQEFFVPWFSTCVLYVLIVSQLRYLELPLLVLGIWSAVQLWGFLKSLKDYGQP